MASNMNRTLIIKQPALFYCDGDEDCFFQWLKSIPAVNCVKGTARGLELTLVEPIDDLSLYELIGLMMRYNLDMKCLRALCNPVNESWFKDKKMYWYKAVFED